MPNPPQCRFPNIAAKIGKIMLGSLFGTEAGISLATFGCLGETSKVQGHAGLFKLINSHTL